MSLIRKHVAVLQAWACLALVALVVVGTIQCVSLFRYTVNELLHDMP